MAVTLRKLAKGDKKIKIETNWLELLQSLYSMPPKWLDITFITIIVALNCITYCISEEINRTILQTLIQIYSTILGFGVGGYAVFAVTSNKDYIIDLIDYESPTYKLPLYKVHLMVLIKFIIVTSLALLFLTLIYFSLIIQENDHYRSQIMGYLGFLGDYTTIANTTNIIVSLFTGALIGSSIIELKNFVFNIYNMSLTYAKYLCLNRENPKIVPERA